MIKYINLYTDFGSKKLFGEEAFEYDQAEEKHKFRCDIALKDQDGEVLFDKLHFKVLQMPLR